MVGWRRRSARVCAVLVLFVTLLVFGPPAAGVLEPSGHPVAGFDADGSVRTNFATVDTFAEARGVGVQSVGGNAGRVVVAGGYQDGFDTHVALLRIEPDGTQDFGFGAGGEVKTTVGSNDLAEDVVIQPDDKIVVAGFSDNSAMVLRYLPDGALDTTFGGGDGVVTFQVLAGQQTRLRSVILQPDGKILVAGSAIVTPEIPDPTPGEPPYQTPSDRAALVARLNANGTIDTSFGGGDGYATLNISLPDPIPGFVLGQPQPLFVGGSDRATGLAIQPDGRIVFVGSTPNVSGSTCNQTAYADSQSLIGRLNANGTPDNTFDTDGHRIVGLGTTGNCPDDSLNNVAIQPDGKIVAVGGANTTQDSATNAKSNISVARFEANGAFDNTFSSDGRLATAIASTSGFLSDIADDVSILANGDLLVGASTDQGGPAPGPCCTFITENDFAALRYNADGTLDNGFAGDGIGIYDFSENDTFDAMTLDASGRPLLVGYSYVAGQFEDPLVAVARVATDGGLDPTFNSAGTPPGTFFKKLQGGSVDLGAGVVRQGTGANTGKLVVVGSTDVGSQTDVGLVRYTTAGALDTTFSGDGKATGDDGSRNDAPSAAAVQGDDKIVVVGTSFGTSGSPRATVMRFNANSGLDGSFGGGDGIHTTTIGTNANQWDAVAMQPDGKIVVGGTVSDTAANWDFLVGRVNANGTSDTSFSGDGFVRLSLGTNVDRVHAVAVQPDGKIVVGGSTFVSSAAQHFALARFNADGSTDTTFGGGDGIVTTPIGGGQFPRNEITGLVVLADGRIIAGGNGNDGVFNSNNVIRLVRYLANGNVDTTFGSNGVVTTNLAGNRFDRVGGIGLQYDDKLVVFGHSQQVSVSNDDFVIARYNWDDGSLDTTYGTSNVGYTVLAATAGADQAAGGVVFPDGSAAIGGTSGSSDFGAARFQGDPAPIVPGAPSLDAASDSGSSSSDRITNDNTPSFSGASCDVGDTTVLRIDGSTGNPLSRSLCRTGAYTATIAAPLADGTHTIGAFARNGAGDSANTATVEVVIDTVANPPTITSPTEGSTVDLPPNPTISGTVDETIPGAAVEVREGTTTVCTAVADATGNWSCVAALLPGSHTLTARQTDIAGNTSNDSAGRTFGVRSPTSTEVSTSVDPSVYGQTVTFTAEVTPLAGTAVGDVDFVVDGETLGTSAVDASGTATLSVPNPPDDPLDVGEHTVVANFLGSTYYLASSDSLDDDQTVDPADTEVEITTAANPSAYGAATTFTFTVSPVAPGAGTPTGDVRVSIDGAAPQDLPLAAGVATLTTSSLVPGSHTITATYLGETRFNPSEQASLDHEIAKGASTVTVTSSADPSSFGQSVTFTATVAAVAPAPGTPAGSVVFTIDGVDQTPVALSAGTATFTTSTLAAGTHTVAATYQGSTLFDGSTGNLAGDQQVSQGASTTTVSVSPTPSVFGQSVTFTVSVDPVAPAPGPLTGTVDLVIDGGTPITLTLVNGQATHVTDALAAGTHTATATYAGTLDVAGSTSAPVDHTVAQASTTTEVAAVPNPSTFGETVVFTATVEPVAPGAGTPSGSVSFVIDGGTPVVVPMSAGVAVYESDAFAAGNHTVVANYGGDAGFLPSTDTLDGGQDVGQAGSTTSVASSANPSAFGDDVTITVTVDPNAPSTTTPTGDVDLVVDGATVDTETLSGGEATFTLAGLAVGTHTVTAIYGGDADHAASQGDLDPDQVVSAGASTTTLTSSAASTTYGEAVTFTATVDAVAPAPGTPTGTVAFVIDGGTPVDVALVGGVAELTTSDLAAGPHTVFATYSGDGSFGGSADDLDADHVVEVAETTTAVTSSLDPSAYGQAVTFTVDVSAADSTPTGSVTLEIDDAPVELTLVDGQATHTVSDLTAGEHVVTATYAGDGNHDPSDGALADDQTVQRAPTRLGLDIRPDPPVGGKPITFLATIERGNSPATARAGSSAGATASARAGQVTAAAVAAPLGTMSFVLDGAVVADVPVTEDGATHTMTLPAGVYELEVRYSGDANHEPITFVLSGGLEVEAAAQPNQPGTNVGGSGATPSGSSGTSGSMPSTGTDPVPLTTVGLLLVACGAALLFLRRRARRHLG